MTVPEEKRGRSPLSEVDGLTETYCGSCGRTVYVNEQGVVFRTCACFRSPTCLLCGRQGVGCKCKALRNGHEPNFTLVRFIEPASNPNPGEKR